MYEVMARGDLLGELRELLLKHPGIKQVLVSRLTLRNALNEFLDGRIAASDLVEWANLVEQCNDEIVYEMAASQLIADLIFRFATPEINLPLDVGNCRGMLAELTE